jgi:hypothetical protein
MPVCQAIRTRIAMIALQRATTVKASRARRTGGAARTRRRVASDRLALLRWPSSLTVRDGVVRDVALHAGKGWVQMEVVVRGDGQVALWSVDRHRDIFEEAFGMTLEVVAIPE